MDGKRESWPLSGARIRELGAGDRPGEFWVCSEEPSVRRIRLESAAIVSLPGHPTEIQFLTWSADGAQWVSGDADGTLRAGNETLEIRNPAVTSRFHPALPDLLAIGEEDGVSFWSLSKKSLIDKLRFSNLCTLSWSSSGEFLLGASRDGWVCCWHLDGTRKWEVEACKGGINRLFVSPDEGMVLVVPTADRMCLLSVRTGRMRPLPRSISAATWEGEELLVGSLEGTLSWLDQPAPLARLGAAIRELRMTSLGALACTDQGELFLFDKKSDFPWRARVRRDARCWLQPGERRWLLASDRHGANLFRLGHPDTRAIPLPTNGKVTAAAFTPDGNRLLVGTDQGGLQIIVVGASALRECLDRVSGELEEKERAAFFG